MFQKTRPSLFLVLLAAMLAACWMPTGTTIPPSAEIPAPRASQTASLTPEVQALGVTPRPGLPPASISQHPLPEDYSFINPHPTSLPEFNPDPGNPFQFDFRSSNLRDLDLSASLDLLQLASFDSRTKWPWAEQLPAGFSVQQTMEMGKDPGLGVRDVHAKGITGSGVGIAIIDQTLLVDHQEYVDQIRVYEEGQGVSSEGSQASMHGPAVASIAVGKTVGVAPDADLYFIAMGGCNGDGSHENFNFTCLAKDVMRILAINQGLPEGRKMRVLSMSIGWAPDQEGYEEMNEAVNEAKAAGIFVVSSNLGDTYGFEFQGMARDFQVDPNRFEAYLPGFFWAQPFYDGNITLSRTLLVPMDARTTASPTGYSDYVYYGEGGLSWAIPYTAGMYALACQVDPGISPEQFWSAALQTGRTIQVEHAGKQYSLGVILDARALIAELQK